jgi:nickel transport protein
MNRTALILLALLATQQAHAHGVYVAQRHGELAVVIGEGASDEAYEPGQVTAVEGLRANGEAVKVKRIARGDHVVLQPPADAALLHTTVDFGAYSRTGKDAPWQPRGKAALPGAVEGLYAIKYNLSIQASPQLPLAPRGEGLELLPLADPLALRRGDRLPVQVLLDGQPLAGVKLSEDFIANSHALSAATDAQGRTQVKLHADSLNVIALEHDQPQPTQAAEDFKRYFSSLSFALEHHEH